MDESIKVKANEAYANAMKSRDPFPLEMALLRILEQLKDSSELNDVGFLSLMSDYYRDLAKLYSEKGKSDEETSNNEIALRFALAAKNLEEKQATEKKTLPSKPAPKPDVVKDDNEEKSVTSHNTEVLVWTIAGAGIFVAILSVIYAVLAKPSDSEWIKISGGGWVILTIIWLFMAINDQCPSCKRLGTAHEVNVYQTGSRLGYKTVTRERKDSEGNVTSRWNEQVRIKTVSYRHDKECTVCKHKWYTTSKSEYTDFDE